MFFENSKNKPAYFKKRHNNKNRSSFSERTKEILRRVAQILKLAVALTQLVDWLECENTGLHLFYYSTETIGTNRYVNSWYGENDKNNFTGH